MLMVFSDPVATGQIVITAIFVGLFALFIYSVAKDTDKNLNANAEEDKLTPYTDDQLMMRLTADVPYINDMVVRFYDSLSDEELNSLFLTRKRQYQNYPGKEVFQVSLMTILNELEFRGLDYEL